MLGLYIIVIWIIVIERFLFYLYDIDLTHIRQLTLLLPRNLTTMWLWTIYLI